MAQTVVGVAGQAQQANVTAFDGNAGWLGYGVISGHWYRGTGQVVVNTAYLDQTGSGVETIAHLRENGRIVVMFCAFEGPPRIVRLHGTGRVFLKDSPEFESLVGQFPGGSGVGVRSVITVDVDRISDSCGNGVPLMNFEGHRPNMDQYDRCALIRNGAIWTKTISSPFARAWRSD